jgi:hypothetical protein
MLERRRLFRLAIRAMPIATRTTGPVMLLAIVTPIDDRAEFSHAAASDRVEHLVRGQRKPVAKRFLACRRVLPQAETRGLSRGHVGCAGVRHGIRDSGSGIAGAFGSCKTASSQLLTEYGVNPSDYVGFHSGAPGRGVAAYLCRRYTTATLAELSSAFGLSHRDSPGTLVKRARRALEENPEIDRRTRKIEKRLCLKPESRV